MSSKFPKKLSVQWNFTSSNIFSEMLAWVKVSFKHTGNHNVYFFLFQKLLRDINDQNLEQYAKGEYGSNFR